ncbi:hypothetical protein F7R25_03810 [Burkholderia stagnalis]|uniref:Uncharacterized protein n=1 Tax=Burkholderia stagnalis TaxID=1503054 RepID=A0A6L3N3I8_9BURK|nr:hypothetical protein [Burkholderia stagnalis]KAB0640630.1 hypothetical protein F7R25_03810 [Burkholderia stagnalis]
MNKIASLFIFLSSQVFAGSISQNIQVTATVLPYCHVVVDQAQARNECFTNKSAAPIVTTTTSSQPINSPAPVVVSKETIGDTQRVTFYY